MRKTGSPDIRQQSKHLRRMALIPLAWFVFFSLLPDFVMRVSGHMIPWLSGAASGIGIVLICLFAGYLLLKARTERWMYLPVAVAITLLVVFQVFRHAQTVGLLDTRALGHCGTMLRALDNLSTGLGLVLIAFTYFYAIIGLLTSRQQLQAEHDRLAAEVARREQTERRLDEHQALLDGVGTSALDAIIVMDNAGAVTYWNPAAERILGYRAEEILGRPVHDILVTSGQRPACAEGLLSWQESGQGSVVGRTLTLKAVPKSGDEIDVALSVSSVEILGKWHAVGILRDITEQKRTEALLRDSEERYRSLFVDSRDAIMTVAPDRGFLAANPATIALFRCRDEQEFATHTPASLSPEFQPDGAPSAEKSQEMMRLALEQGAHYFEWTHRRADGAEFPATVLLSRFEHGGAPLLMGTVRDITERKRVQEQLTESEARYRALFDQAANGIVFMSLDQRTTVMNQTFASMHGYDSPEEMEGLGLKDIDTPETARLAPERLRRLMSGEPMVFEVEHYRKDGSTFPLEVSARVIEFGGMRYFLGFHQDITERRRTQAALQESEEKYRVLVENSIEGIGITKGNQVVFVNETLLDMLGYETLEELTKVPLLEHIAPEYRDLARRRLQQRASGNLDTPFSEYEVLTKDSRTKLVQTCTADIVIGGERLTQITLHDITELKRAEEEKRDLEAQVQHRQKLESLGVLTGGIAHDFNNILHLILGNLHHAQKTIPEDAPAYPFLDNIERSAERAAALTRQMLAYSGRGSCSLEILDLSETVGEIVQLIQSSVSKKVLLETYLATGLPPVEADAAQIQQVAFNLVLNASEAVDEEHGGVVTVSTMALHCDEAFLSESRAIFDASKGEYVCLEVSDTGCGMSEETRARLFDPFFTTKFTGRGLGMSAVLGIVRAHEGAILVDSAPGEGTTIRILLPVSACPPPEHAAAAAGDVRSGAAVFGNGRTILFVDDEPDMLELGGYTLKQMGYALFTASDGFEALEIYRAHHAEIDCVLLDLSMPRMDGVETLLELRRINPAVRVILVSGYAEQELQERFDGLEVGTFMEKPYNSRKLAAALEQVLG